MFIRYIRVSALEHDIVTMAEYSSGKRFRIESQHTGQFFSTDDLNVAMRRFRQFASDASARERAFNNF